MAPRAGPVVVQGGGGSAGILLLFIAVVGLVALFSGNLDRFVQMVAGSAGGPEGLHRTSTGGSGGSWTPAQPRPGTWGEVTPPGTGAAGDPSRPREGPW